MHEYTTNSWREKGLPSLRSRRDAPSCKAIPDSSLSFRFADTPKSTRQPLETWTPILHTNRHAPQRQEGLAAGLGVLLDE